MRGTMLIAPEGINATLSGPPEPMAATLAELRADPRFAGLTTREAWAGQHPFARLKVKLKREIIAFGRPEADPVAKTGTRVAPTNWNDLIASPDVLLLDTRNQYEVAAGTFEGATDPRLQHFRHFPDYVAAKLDPAKHKRVAMFCTGGIRCEKASAYLLAHGFEQVYQLDGGILAYLEHVTAAESRWQGGCFVFDERETVTGPDARAETV
jgi:UPF0176 protein